MYHITQLGFKARSFGWELGGGSLGEDLDFGVHGPSTQPQETGSGLDTDKESRAGWTRREGSWVWSEGVVAEGPRGSVSHQVVLVTGLEKAAGGGCNLRLENQ